MGNTAHETTFNGVVLTLTCDEYDSGDYYTPPSGGAVEEIEFEAFESKPIDSESFEDAGKREWRYYLTEEYPDFVSDRFGLPKCTGFDAWADAAAAAIVGHERDVLDALLADSSFEERIIEHFYRQMA